MQIKRHFLKLLFLSVIVFLTVISCRKDNIFLTKSSAILKFETDTVFFDTVFTTIGSATKRFKVYNPYNSSIRISKIWLGGGSSSAFRINIDGQPGTSVTNYDVLPKDSFYIFVDVTVNPNNLSSPFIDKDSILFETNGNLQNIKLVAWGQNANYFRRGILYHDTTWTNNKPYVVFDYVDVRNPAHLTIDPGVKIYFNGGAGIIIRGTLNVQGTKDQPVLMTGLRLEYYYLNNPGQWYGLLFLPRSLDNNINFCTIKNATVGIEVDSLPVDNYPNLILESVRIENMSSVGLLGYTAHIKTINTLIDNSCGYLVVGSLGGQYEFYSSTFYHSNCNCFNVNTNPAMSFDNTPYRNGHLFIPSSLSLNIRSSIIWGNNGNEQLVLSDSNQAGWNVNIDHSLLETQNPNFSDKTLHNIINIDPKLVSPCEYKFEPDTLSPVIGKGKTLAFSIYDLNGNQRNSPPDMGAIERKR